MIASAEFLDQWMLEDMPACDEGMALLEQFARTHTEEWKFVMTAGLNDLRPHIIAIHSGLWIVFATHVNAARNATRADCRKRFTEATSSNTATATVRHIENIRHGHHLAGSAPSTKQAQLPSPLPLRSHCSVNYDLADYALCQASDASVFVTLAAERTASYRLRHGAAPGGSLHVIAFVAPRALNHKTVSETLRYKCRNGRGGHIGQVGRVSSAHSISWAQQLRLTVEGTKWIALKHLQPPTALPPKLFWTRDMAAPMRI